MEVRKVRSVLPSTLTVSIVTHQPDFELLERSFIALARACVAARDAGALGKASLVVIDNSEDGGIVEHLHALCAACFGGTGIEPSVIAEQTNVGYGRANNRALREPLADYHLVQNPDVELDHDALLNALRWMDAHPEVAALAPAVRDDDGKPEYLCKRYPAVFDLALRAFAPQAVRDLFRARLDRYELRDRIDAARDQPVFDVPLLSGACMLVRSDAIVATRGFDPAFFLYFEDYDWSIRLARVGRNAFLPTMRIVHHGGGAARKGSRHIRLFATSAARFYGKHGWRWW